VALEGAGSSKPRSKRAKAIKADEVKAWLPRLTKYERARIIGARALQISMGAPLLLPAPPEDVDPVKIAAMELEAGLLPITVRRRLGGGRYQDVPLQWLLEGEASRRRRRRLQDLPD